MFFFPDRSLSREILFPSTNFLSAQSPFEDSIREVSFLPRFVLNKPCVERASTCQARACTGAEGFIHSEESVGALIVSSATLTGEIEDSFCTKKVVLGYSAENGCSHPCHMSSESRNNPGCDRPIFDMRPRER